ncbi:MAG: MarR family winged helix-turn-helix transcriptional regulator [Rhodothermaceae bacterium]
MENDFLRELEFLGVTARLKRLSDTLSKHIKDLYKENNLEIEPSWHLIFLYLEKNGVSTMSEIAEALHFSQPAITKMLNRMSNKGYIEVTRDKTDTRKKNIQLSKKAKKEFPEFLRVWNGGQKAVKQILRTNKHFLPALESFENQITAKSFNERAGKNIK